MANMTPDEVEKHLDQYSKWLENGVITQKEYDDAVKDAVAGVKGYTAQLRASMGQLGTSL